MPRFSIARRLRLTLLGLTLALSVVAALGVARLLNARQGYDAALANAAAISVAEAQMSSLLQDESDLAATPASPSASRLRRQAREAFSAQAAQARRLAAGDPAARRIVEEEVRLEAGLRPGAGRSRVNLPALNSLRQRLLSLSLALSARQVRRQAAASAQVRARSRSAVLLVALAAGLALLAALALVSYLVASLRRPLDGLVRATRALAAGELEQRVRESGPQELQELAQAFNGMAGSLQAAQGRLEEQRRRLSVTIESLGDGLLITHPDSCTVAAVNPRAQELLPELPVGTDTRGEGSPLPPLEQAYAGEVIVEHGGRSLAVTAAELEGGGTVWTVRDISDRVRLERAKSEFVATASHELRSPLTSIKGFVELLARSPENMSERQREFIDIVLRSTDRLVELVGDLLDVARIEADRVELDRRPIDVAEAVREVAALMGPRVEEKGQRLELHLPPRIPLAMADPGRVRQILANLLTNAHLYTSEGGSIRVSVEPDRAWVQLTVSDTGVGMSPEEQEHVFERFYRSPDRARSSTGTGLGLAIVKSLVELHRGHVEVHSEPGTGTTFTVRLPAAVPGVESLTALDSIRGRRVLILDDEREVAELIAGQLAPLDVRAEIVTDGETAIRRLREEEFDAMTLDILMPATDGFEVLRRVRTDPQLRNTPIVFVSVFSGRQELAGEWAVSKPIDADELRSVLGAAVRAGRSRVLVVAREELASRLEPALADLGIEHQWESNGAAAARVCGELRFELALIDVGIRNPRAVLQALDLRGRRLRQAVILFTDGTTPVPPGVHRLGMEVVPVEQAGSALVAALRGEGSPAAPDGGG